MQQAALPPDLLEWAIVAIVLFRAWALQQEHRRTLERIADLADAATVAVRRYAAGVQRAAPPPELAMLEHQAVTAADAVVAALDAESGS